jgi:hypothetical protein
MITLKEFFDTHGDNGLNIDFLLDLYEGVDVLIAPMVLGVGGFTTHEKIYINTNCFRNGVEFFYYVALHELAHYKRINKIGSDFHINKLSSSDFKEFVNHIIQEEIIADRYACLMFYIVNGEEAPYSQGLENSIIQEQYKPKIKDAMFGKIDFDLDNYKKMGESLLV